MDNKTDASIAPPSYDQYAGRPKIQIDSPPPPQYHESHANVIRPPQPPQPTNHTVIHPQPIYGQPTPSYDSGIIHDGHDRAIPTGVPLQGNFTTQPGSVTVTAVPIGIPATAGRYDFIDGLCACCNDPASFCLALFFPPLRVGQTVAKANLDTKLAGMLKYGIIWVATVVFFLLLAYDSVIVSLYFISWGILAMVGQSYRKRLRHLYGFHSRPCEDFMVHCCCGPCAVAQEARHVDAQPQAGGWPANTQLGGAVIQNNSEPPQHRGPPMAPFAPGTRY